METVVRLRGSPVEDPYSGTMRDLDWSRPCREEIDGCVVYPASTGESSPVGRSQAEERLTVLLPDSADVNHLDRLIIRGREYQVDGIPFQFEHPMTGWRPGVQLEAVRSLG